MSTRAKTPAVRAVREPDPEPQWGLFRRVLEGVLPAPDGGPPEAVKNARAHLVATAWTVGGAALGCVIGIVVGLAITHVPDVPGAAIAFALGALLGGGMGVLVALRSPGGRKAGLLAVVAFPLLLVASPFLLAGAAVLAMRGRKAGRGARRGA